MVVLHLSSGHVLAAVAAGGRNPTVADLTGGTSLPVRLPDGATVAVTSDLLTATAVPSDTDVLTRPTSFRVADGVPPVTVAGPAKNLRDSANNIVKVADEGTECVSLWQAGDQLEVVRETLDSFGKPKAAPPPGGTRRLVACKGSPLFYET